MAYMRGDYYIYRTESDKDSGTIEIHTPEGSLSIPIEIFDALVCMRYAQIEKEKDIKTFEKEVVEAYSGNFGVDALLGKLGMQTTHELLSKMVVKSKKR